jgi:hypothetical protein
MILMISFRQLFIIALLIAGLWLLRRLRQRIVQHRRMGSRSNLPYQEMVRCVGCGVYLPRSEAGGNAQTGFFCNATHCLERAKQHNR